MVQRRMEVFFLLALAAHLAFFSMVSFRPTGRFVSSIHDRVDSEPLEQLVKKEESPEKRVAKRAPVQVAQLEEPLVVIPVPADGSPRWIVELVDIPREEEPEDARFVSERPSRVEEEVRAEHTAREPKRATKRKKTGKKRKSKRYVKKRAKKRRIASRPKPETSRKPEAPAVGIPVEGPGEVPVLRGDKDVMQKPSRKNDLFPTLGELARNTPSPRTGDSPTRTGRIGGDSEMPGVPSAPENFLPLVKKRGPITLLNAKSYRFSGFVRRVARRIFDRFVMGFQPRRFAGTDYAAMRKGAVYEAIMNRTGRTVNIKRRRSSGSSRFDSLASSAVRKGAWDTNVPDGAECADGFVHFVFIPKITPTNPTTATNGSRVYTNFYILAVAGLKECE